MQLLSLGPLLGAIGVQQVSPTFQEFLNRPEMQRFGAFLIGLCVAGVVVTVLSWWAASKAIVKRDTATLGSAVKVCLGHFLFFVVTGVLLGFLVPLISTVEQAWRQIAFYGGFVLLGVIAFFNIPMKIYFIGFWRAFGVFLFATFINVVVTNGLAFAAQALLLSEKDRAALVELSEANAEEWRDRLEGSQGASVSAQIDRLLDEASRQPRPPLARREASIRKLQKKLDQRRRALPPGDHQEATAFQRQLDRYLKLLREVKAERNNPAANREAYCPAENFTSLVA